jgi:monovalent cation/proton antiporter MnhG/PhaG subunit
MIWVGALILILGTIVSLLAAIGVLTFPSPIARMHAATKSASVGLALITIGAGVLDGSPGMIGVGILVSVFLFVTAPISGHMVARAAYRTGQQPPTAHDDLAGVDPEPLAVETPEQRRFSPARWISALLTWVLLWRDFTLANIVGGAAVATIIELLRSSTGKVLPVRPVAALRLIGFYLLILAKSNARVAWEVITPDDSTIEEAIVEYELTSPSRQIALLVANAVTFSPGTLTLELAGDDPIVLYVHVLHFESVDAVRAEIAALEQRVQAAFGVSESIVDSR